MGSEFVLSLNEKEKAFIEQYQDLVIDNNGDEKVINGILKYIAKDVKDYDNLIKIVYSEVKKKLYQIYNQRLHYFSFVETLQCNVSTIMFS